MTLPALTRYQAATIKNRAGRAFMAALYGYTAGAPLTPIYRTQNRLRRAKRLLARWKGTKRQ